MNTHTSFHQRLLRQEHPHIAYHIGLCVTTGCIPPHWPFKPIDQDATAAVVEPSAYRNHTLYAQAALSAFGIPIRSEELYGRLNDDVGECVQDPSAFICHAFARTEWSKEQLVRTVARQRRQQLVTLLHVNQQMRFVTLDDAAALT